MENIQIQVATERDAVNILNFKNLYFHNCDPIELAHPEDGHQSSNLAMLIEAIKRESALMAIDESTSAIVGILIGSSIDANEAERIKKAAIEVGDPKRAEIFNFLAYIEEKADFCKRLNIDQCFNVHNLCVHPSYKGLKIASKLFAAIVEIAKLKNFKFICANCSSVFSAKIAENLGMDLVSTVSYQEYNDYLGKTLFVPVPPHEEIKSFVKRL